MVVVIVFQRGVFEFPASAMNDVVGHSQAD